MLLAACESGPEPATQPKGIAPPASPTFLTLAFTGNIKGIIDPCGCTKKQLGGLARRATILEELREKSDNVIYVDYGNWLFPVAPLSDMEREQRIEKARLHIKAANQMGLAAFTPGPSDFAAGTEALKELLKKATFPTVSANLVDPDTGAPLFETHTILEVGGMRLGITGVSEPVSSIPQLAGEAQAIEPLEALKDVLTELRPKVHRILVLTRPGGETPWEISALPGVDFVIGSPNDVGVGEARGSGNAIVASVSDRGQRVGAITVQLQPGRTGYYAGNRMLAIEQEVAEARERAAQARAEGNEDLAAANEKLIASRSEELEKLHRQMGFLHNFFEIDESVEPNEPQFLMVDYFRRRQEQRAREIYGRGWDEYLKDQHDFGGAQACMGCHQGIHDHWKETRHADAFESLAKTHQTSDNDCLKCHTTGYQNAWQGNYAPELFRGVSCEACHGESGPHSRDPLVVKPPWVVQERTCRRCHGIQHGEEFDYQQSLQKILHPDMHQDSMEPPSEPESEAQTDESPATRKPPRGPSDEAAPLPEGRGYEGQIAPPPPPEKRTGEY